VLGGIPGMWTMGRDTAASLVGSNPLSIDASLLDCQPDPVGLSLVNLKVTSARPGEVSHGIPSLHFPLYLSHRP